MEEIIPQPKPKLRIYLLISHVQRNAVHSVARISMQLEGVYPSPQAEARGLEYKGGQIQRVPARQRPNFEALIAEHSTPSLTFDWYKDWGCVLYEHRHQDDLFTYNPRTNYSVRWMNLYLSTGDGRTETIPMYRHLKTDQYPFTHVYSRVYMNLNWVVVLVKCARVPGHFGSSFHFSQGGSIQILAFYRQRSNPNSIVSQFCKYRHLYEEIKVDEESHVLDVFRLGSTLFLLFVDLRMPRLHLSVLMRTGRAVTVVNMRRLSTNDNYKHPKGIVWRVERYRLYVYADTHTSNQPVRLVFRLRF